jgi:hypothetical protein
MVKGFQLPNGEPLRFCVELILQTLRNVLMQSAWRGIHKMLSNNDFVTKPIFWNFSRDFNSVLALSESNLACDSFLQSFTDGGVFDNLGVRMFPCLERPMLLDNPRSPDDIFDFQKSVDTFHEIRHHPEIQVV